MPDINVFHRPIPSLADCIETLSGLLKKQLLEIFPENLNGEAEQLAGRLFDTVKAAPDDVTAAKEAQQLLDTAEVRRYLRDGLGGRSQLIFDQVKDYVVGPNILDYGCGDGEVGRRLSELGHNVELWDVLDYRSEESRALAWHTIAENDAYRPSEIVSTVLLLTVLHHCTNPVATIHRVASLNPQRIITIESVFDIAMAEIAPAERVNGVSNAKHWLDLKPDHQFHYACFWDWFYNKVVNSGVIVPYNYLAPCQWSTFFDSIGYKEVRTEYLGIDQPLVPEFHVLQVYDRRQNH